MFIVCGELSLTQKILALLGVSFFSYFLFKYLWSRRYLYYYASKVNGPVALPIIGNVHLLAGGTHEILSTLCGLCAKYKPICRFWFVHKLGFIITGPAEVKTVLNTCMEKVDEYQYINPAFGKGLFTLPASEWKIHRKLIATTFGQNVLNTFVEIYAKHSNLLVEKLKDTLGNECVDMFPIMTHTVVDILAETTMGINLDNLHYEVHDMIIWTVRLAELCVLRAVNPFYHIDFIWKFSANAKETKTLLSKVHHYIKEIVREKRLKNQRQTSDDLVTKKIFLDEMFRLTNNDDTYWSDDVLAGEIQTILVAGGDAISMEVSYVLMMLGMHPEIQTKVHEELFSVFGDSRREVTKDDLDKLVYLEYVIKETLRLFPAGSTILREVYKDVNIGSITLPKGSKVAIPILAIHRDGEIWPDPLKFDPLRFVPSEFDKKHPYSFLPFSGGPRGCIGFKYGYMAMKTILATVLRHYKVVETEFKSIPDVKLKLDIATKCIGGQKVRLEKI